MCYLFAAYHLTFFSMKHTIEVWPFRLEYSLEDDTELLSFAAKTSPTTTHHTILNTEEDGQMKLFNDGVICEHNLKMRFLQEVENYLKLKLG